MAGPVEVCGDERLPAGPVVVRPRERGAGRGGARPRPGVADPQRPRRLHLRHHRRGDGAARIDRGGGRVPPPRRGGHADRPGRPLAVRQADRHRAHRHHRPPGLHHHRRDRPSRAGDGYHAPVRLLRWIGAPVELHPDRAPHAHLRRGREGRTRDGDHEPDGQQRPRSDVGPDVGADLTQGVDATSPSAAKRRSSTRMGAGTGWRIANPNPSDGRHGNVSMPAGPRTSTSAK